MNNDNTKEAYLIEELLAFGIKNNMISKYDIVYVRNHLLDLLKIEEPYGNVDLEQIDVPNTATPILEKMLDYAYDKGILPENTLTHRDLLDTKIMGLLMPKPSEIIQRFNNIKSEKSVEDALDDFYNLCEKTDYIRVDRIARNIHWLSPSAYGDLEVTINLTKPEKDPKEVAALKTAPQVGYPKCVLCSANVGYAGRINHPARQTLRTLPVELDGEQWHFQYSPYVYYNHHCIVFNEQHVPMKISRETFVRLLDFLDDFPHYFIGSNADLPIVGGSILNHDHFQGGYHTFAMERASMEYSVYQDRYPSVQVGVVKWPMSVLRLTSKNKVDLIEMSDMILGKWKEYSDAGADILAYSKDEKNELIPHNTITPIARINKDGDYEMDLVLRNNRTSPEHPMGIFHPHEELHHIKRENIGLIEVMGLFILPGRLKDELSSIGDILTGKTAITDELKCDSHPLSKHLPWIEELIQHYGTNLDAEDAHRIIEDSVGDICMKVLEHAGVFKTTPEGRQAFNRFLESCGIKG